MKVNVKAVKRTGIVLSVGMIIKNEEKNLDRCLSALKPFLDSIKSELIIVDTGSSDSSREIARKYTDKVYDFEWCDDFSAARNDGLRRARGEWFMFVDADECLDADFSEMTKFFSLPELSKKYNSASVIIRSYSDSEDKLYVDFLGSRIVRLLPNVRFEGLIHEALPMAYPHGYFSTVFHHYGYKYQTQADRDKKLRRNLDLLYKEYEAEPQNLRTMSHIYDSSLSFEEKREILTKAYDIAADKPLSMYVSSTYLNCITFYSRTDKSRAVDYAREFLMKDGAKKRVAAVQATSALADLLCEMHDYEAAVEAFESYFKLYDDYHDGKLDNADMRARGIKGITSPDRSAFSIAAALCLVKLGRHDEGIEQISACKIEELSLNVLKTSIPAIKEICIAAKNYSILGKFYIQLLEKKDENPLALELFMAMVSSIFYELDIEQRDKFAKTMGECGENTSFCVLMKIITLENMAGFAEVLDDFCAVCKEWDGCMAEAVWLCMKHGVKLNNASLNMSYNDMRSLFPYLCRNHKNFAEVALAYSEVFVVENMRDLLLLCSMLETAALAAAEMKRDARYELYNLFTSALGDYVLNVYNSELLNDDDIAVLPSLHCFGYYMAQAHLSVGNHVEYMKNLRNALKSAPETKDMISFLMDEYSQRHMNG